MCVFIVDRVDFTEETWREMETAYRDTVSPSASNMGAPRGSCQVFEIGYVLNGVRHVCVETVRGYAKTEERAIALSEQASIAKKKQNRVSCAWRTSFAWATSLFVGCSLPISSPPPPRPKDVDQLELSV